MGRKSKACRHKRSNNTRYKPNFNIFVCTKLKVPFPLSLLVLEKSFRKETVAVFTENGRFHDTILWDFEPKAPTQHTVVVAQGKTLDRQSCLASCLGVCDVISDTAVVRHLTSLSTNLHAPTKKQPRRVVLFLDSSYLNTPRFI